jgi:S1-C subfamily serine protease
VLHNTPNVGGTVKADVTRDGKPMEVSLVLDKNWKQKDDISWRASTWGFRRKVFGGFFPVELPEEERTKLKLPEGKMAYLIQHVGQFAPHDIAHKAGVKRGDVLVGFDGRNDILRETDLIAYVIREKKPGDTVNLDILRDSTPKSITIKLP